MADIKWSAFPSTTGTTAGDSVVGLHSGANERFLVSSTPSASGIAVWDANSNLSANNTINGYATTATAAGTTTLTVASKYQQYLTGSTTQTVVMPVTSTLALGQSYLLVNDSSNNSTVNASDGSLILIVTPDTQVTLTCISVAVTTSAAWSNQYVLKELSPSQANANVVITGGGTTNSPGYSLSYTSFFVNNIFYKNLLTSNFYTASINGATAVNYGNIQVINNAFTIALSNITSITCPNLIAILGLLTINSPNLTNFSVPNLVYISQSTIITNSLLTTFSMPNLVNTSGQFTFTASPSLAVIDLPLLNNIFGSLSGTLPALTTLTLSGLLNITAAYSLTANALTTLSCPSLLSIGTNFAPAGTLLSTVNMPVLTSVGGTFSPTLAVLTTLTVTSLQTVTGAFGLTAATLTTLSLPALTTLGAGFSPVCALATTVTLTLLANVTGTFVPSFAALTTLSLPALVSISGLLTITAANLVAFSMGSTLKSIGGNFTMSGMKLDQASVDGILVSLAALDGTGGTTAYSSKTINLSGGTSSAPSATGLAAKTVLLARSCTVTTN